MSDNTAIIIAIITAGASFFASVVAAIGSVLNNILGRKNEVHIKETKDKMDALEENTNSKMDALLKLKGESEHAKGVLAGQQTALIVPQSVLEREGIWDDIKGRLGLGKDTP